MEFSHWFGDTVYIKTDRDQSPRMVCDFELKPNGVILYGVSGGTESSLHYDFELTSEPNLVLKTTN